MFAERLKTLRKEAGLTQKQIAMDLRITQPAYQQWESGKRNPAQETLKMFSEYFKVSIDYLLGNTDIKNSAELSDTDLLNIINTGSASYDGKPLNKHDEETLKQVLKDYFDGKLKDYN